ncbi:MAG: DUF4115 domain-containing protein [Gammaproteobacteria bacterium]|nr:DUF4115 domain-containing protein [Gammaproteobacteria bacterium]
MPDRPDKKNQPDQEGPGVQLRRAREAAGLLLHDVAQELHLDEWMLQALEEDDFAALGAPVFAKGHMRKYGSMLGLDTDDLMIAYYRKRGRDDSPPPITKIMQAEPDKPQMSGQWLRWVLGAVVALIVLSLTWAFLNREQSGSTSADVTAEAVVPAVVPAPRVAAVEDPGPTDPDSPAVDETDEQANLDDGAIATTAGDSTDARAESDSIESPAVATVTPEPAPAATTGVQLRLSVSDDSWVEVTDSTGQRLIYDMMVAGRSRSVTGQPPIEVFLGLSRSVRLEVNGEYYAVPRRSIRGNTARFVIDPAAER